VQVIFVSCLFSVHDSIASVSAKNSQHDNKLLLRVSSSVLFTEVQKQCGSCARTLSMTCQSNVCTCLKIMGQQSGCWFDMYCL